jgi:hypothetical protein
MITLQFASQVASITTSIVALVAGLLVLYGRQTRRRKLENYLEATAREPGEFGVRHRTILHLIAALGMSEAEILTASFDSKRIVRSVAANEHTHRAEAILLEYR